MVNVETKNGEIEDSAGAVADRYVFDSTGGHFGRAARDVLLGFDRASLWGYLGVKDVRDRYRGAVMGVSWIVLTTAMLAVGLSFIYGTVFDIPLREYLPYVTIGLSVWSFLSASITESAGVFTSHAAYFNQMPVPLSVFIYRMLVRNLILLGYRMIVVVGVLLFAAGSLQWVQLQAVIGVLVLTAWGFGLAMLLGPLVAKYRDVGQAIGALTTFSFFVTPVFWYPHKLSQYAWVVDYNGLYHLLQLVRDPLLGNPIDSYSLWFGLALATCTILVGFLVFCLTKQKVPYWCQ